MKKQFLAVYSIAVLLAVMAVGALGDVKPYSLFSDNAVLQQGMRVPVWGTADDGQRVTVEFQGQKVSTVSRNGRWMVHLAPLKAGGPFTMTIRSGDQTVELKNILVGEVWVCSGQSNMAWTIKACGDPATVAPNPTDPMLRLYTVPRNDMPREPKASWQEAGPDTVAAFSAVGYFFGKHLRDHLKVPVGLINSSVGGTPAEAWTSRTVLRSIPELKTVIEDAAQKKRRISYLYNGMIAPLQPYAIKGVIWYQGESNAARAYEYRTLFPAMIRNWREAWGQGDFPFLFVQLAPYGRQPATMAESAWAELREAQLLTSLTVPNTAMAVITDVGDCNDIHPKNKKPVGERLGLAARAIAYGEKIVYSAPVYKSAKVVGNEVVIGFDCKGTCLAPVKGELKGFVICGEDRKFVPAKAEVRKCGVVVWSPDVPKPVAVRFGWENCPDLNLFSKEGLPVSPFRTDDFPMATKPQ